MKQLRNAVCALLSTGLLNACGGTHTIPSASLAAPPIAPSLSRNLSSTETVLHSFNGDDGYYPTALVNVNDTLYGTTEYGSNSACWSYVRCGTLYRIETSGSGYRVLHRFLSNDDGQIPVGALADAGGAFYGTTRWGGDTHPCFADYPGCGTVFRIDLSGDRYRTIHRFNGRDGSDAFAGTVEVGGTFYGATLTGGRWCRTTSQSGCGTIYSISPHGKETILHSFAGSPDGGGPAFAPIDVDGTLYGVTNYGGDPRCIEKDAGVTGCGVLYKMSTSGKGYTILYRFKGGEDGAAPASLIDVNGMLYGNTFGGGETPCGSPRHKGCGTIYEISTSGKGHSVLHDFTAGTDGALPDTLAYVNGALYGTTTYGGGTPCQHGAGCGTVYAIGTSGNGYGVIYRFQGGLDGANPDGKNRLVEIGGVLYGVTALGGGTGCQYSLGCGTVFSVMP